MRRAGVKHEEEGTLFVDERRDQDIAAVNVDL